MPLDEITIKVRDNSVSIQGAGVGNKQEETRAVLNAALNALDSDRGKETFLNEIVVEKPK